MRKKKRKTTSNLTIFNFSRNKVIAFIIAVIVSVTVYFIEKRVWISSKNELAKINVCFTPPSGCRDLIIEAITNAKQQILVMGYSFTSKEILEALKDAAYNNVSVKIILDKSQETAKHSIYNNAHPFKNFDIKIDYLTKGIPHNKVIWL